MTLDIKKKAFAKLQKPFELVRLARVELARPCGQQILSLQRLPVPPQAHKISLPSLLSHNFINAR